jgi:hypothetical protein
MRRVNGQFAGKRPAECPIGGDQGAQAFIDLPIFALTPLLHGLNDEQTDAHAPQGDDREPNSVDNRPDQELKSRLRMESF